MPLLVCNPKSLENDQLIDAAITAVKINPLNRAPVEQLSKIVPGLVPTHPYIAVMTSKRWKTDGVKLSVQFLDNPEQALADRILSHMNAWSATANVSFHQTAEVGDVRIARGGGAAGGYWSYLGTDILSIDKDKPTMNLEGFTMTTPDSEYRRVVRHETGHTLGFPHEHMRAELVAKIDRDAALKYYMATQGWSREQVIAQVLTPLDPTQLVGTVHADPNSIMCYQIPATLTTDHEPIIGGLDIDESDYDFAAACYPKPN